MKISVDKKYRTRNGHSVRMLCVGLNTASRFKNAGILLDTATTKESVLTWADDGKYDNSLSLLDLVEVSPYEDFKVDDPVLVSADGTTWHRAHYSCYVGDYAIVFAGGKTSYSSHHDQGLSTRIHYPYCKKATV